MITGPRLDGLDREVDFAAWYRRGSLLDDERDEPVLLVGEAKRLRQECDRRPRVGEPARGRQERFPGAMMVALPSSLGPISEYSTAEIGGSPTLPSGAERGRSTVMPRNPLIVLTATELFSEHGITQAWKTVGGRAADLVKHASVNLTDLYEPPRQRSDCISTSLLSTKIVRTSGGFSCVRSERGWCVSSSARLPRTSEV